MRFIFDRNIPVALARMLNHYDRVNEVTFLDDDGEFGPTTPDVEWMSKLAQRTSVPAIVSGDGRILRNPAEVQVLKNSPLTFFLFVEGWMRLKWAERAWKTVKIWPSIIESASPRRPSLFSVPISAHKVEFLGYTSELGSRKR